MVDFPILSLLTLLPILGAGAIFLFARGLDEDTRTQEKARWIAFGFSAATFLVSLAALVFFDTSNGGFQFVEKALWIPSFGLAYHRGVDGIGLSFVLLTTLLVPLCLLSAFSIKRRARAFMAAFLFMEAMILGVFTTLDFVLFYVFFEGVLIPMFLLIGVWGGEDRIKAAYKFFLYTFLGSVLMLVAVLVMVRHVGTSDMTAMMGGKFPEDMAIWLWLAFFASFAVKTPMVPFHTWLPYAHVEAPTAASVILAGVLLKMGGYGFIRISLQMLPEASALFAPAVMGLSVIAVIYASLVAFAQTDMKKLVAYSSVAHMGTVTLGLFAGNAAGLKGALFVMLSHGLVSAGLFLGVGVLYERAHTREIARFGGVASVMPRYAFCFMLLSLASIGLPGTSGFVGEFLALQGAFLTNAVMAAGGALGVVLGAAVMLWLYRRVFFDRVAEVVHPMADLTKRELFTFAPLLVLILLLGISPMLADTLFGASAEQVLLISQKAFGGR